LFQDHCVAAENSLKLDATWRRSGIAEKALIHQAFMRHFGG
jgi:hypothetical protein